MKRSSNLQSLILKYKNTGEADRLITLLTKEHGKVLVIAKGVRKLKSSKRAFLEPGNLSKVLLIKTKNWYLLTQARLIASTGQTRHNLKQIRKLYQFLEILDKLLVEEELDQDLFKLILDIRQDIVRAENLQPLRQKLKQLIGLLGFDTKNQNNITSLVEKISEQSMKSFDFLKI